ncbi:hypothetical protein KX928_19655 [Roseobacter sp. YSTF-M11]|uniref:DUF1127 domain-containing protein n=1 Tax=Roseobacter insulae TaxID=2859783 RepID=A0A9X1FYP4_9RHOB|nr:hypothetical protein [Roseobacter insulae]MBW4710006.1 hypothetical protein [Roseobacter insulae]
MTVTSFLPRPISFNAAADAVAAAVKVVKTVAQIAIEPGVSNDVTRLDDRMLSDIGLNPECVMRPSDREAFEAIAHRPFW